MSRSARVSRPGTLQHVISRFLDRSWHLVTNIEREHYLDLLGRAMTHTDWKCVAYCIMSHRVELAMVAGEQPLDSWAKRVNPPFAHWLNRQRGRLGPIFAHRPISREIPSNEALALIAYVHNNPVRTKLVATARDVSWSSHRAYLGTSRPPGWLHVEEGLKRSGFARPADFDRAVILLEDRKPAYVLRNDEKDLRRAEPRTTCAVILTLVAAAFGLPVDALQHRYVRGPQSDAKRIAIHIARTCGIPLAEMAEALRISRQRASLVASSPLTVELAMHARDILTALDDLAAEPAVARIG
jgi:hypothetical protein